jgi:hypothetical protein
MSSPTITSPLIFSVTLTPMEVASDSVRDILEHGEMTSICRDIYFLLNSIANLLTSSYGKDKQ